MNPLALLAVSAVLQGTAGATIPSARETSPRLEIVGFTGQIQVKMPYSAKGFSPKGLTPEIPPGSEVVILRGTAIFQSGDTLIRASAGDAFIFHVPLPNGGAARPFLLAAVGKGTALDVQVGDTRAVLRAGSAVAIRSDGPGKARFEVAMGTVVVSRPDQVASLKPGMWVESAVKSGVPVPAPPVEAVAGVPPLPEAERRELRSAPAAAPKASTAPVSGEAPPKSSPIVDPDEKFRDAPNSGPSDPAPRLKGPVANPVDIPDSEKAMSPATHVQHVRIAAGLSLALAVIVAFALFRRSED